MKTVLKKMKEILEGKNCENLKKKLKKIFSNKKSKKMSENKSRRNFEK